MTKPTMTPEQFRIVRELAGLTQEEAAAQIGVSRSTIQRIERGAMGSPIPEKYRRLVLTLKGK